jgi:hypothetical protein
MASILHVLLHFLRKLRFTRGSIHHYIKRWTSFLAFLGRRFGINYLWHDKKRGTSHKPTVAERSFSRTGGRLELGEFVVAASHIPASASHPSLHDVVRATGPPQTTTSRASPPASVRAEPQRDHAHPTTTTLGVGIYSNRSITNLSTLSRASDRLSILQTHSRESLHAPVGQTTRFPRAPHRQFGRGPSASPSRERPSRSPSPPGRAHQPSPTSRIYPLPRLEVDTSNLHPTHVDSRNSPITPPTAVSHVHVHEPLSPPSLHGHRRRQSSTSVVVGIVTPSTESLPLSPLPNQHPLTDEPYTIGSPGDDPSPVADAPNAREGSPQHSPIASSPSAASDLELPEGRFLQLINSEQVPRYTKEVTVQVDYLTTSIKIIKSFCRPRERTFYEIPRLTTSFPQYV